MESSLSNGTIVGRTRNYIHDRLMEIQEHSYITSNDVEDILRATKFYDYLDMKGVVTS